MMAKMLDIVEASAARGVRPDWLAPAMAWHDPARPKHYGRLRFLWAEKFQQVLPALNITPHHRDGLAMVQVMLACPDDVRSAYRWSYLLLDPADLPALFAAYSADPEGTMCVWFREEDTVRRLMRVKPAAPRVDLLETLEDAA